MDATAAALPVLVQDKGKTHKPRGPPLAWRLGVSLAAVALTWATSLRVAISVAGAFVVVPPGSLVRDTCKTLRAATTHAEAVYVECVDAQSAQCDRHYDDVLLDIEKMLQDKQKRNEAKPPPAFISSHMNHIGARTKGVPNAIRKSPDNTPRMRSSRGCGRFAGRS